MWNTIPLPYFARDSATSVNGQWPNCLGNGLRSMVNSSSSYLRRKRPNLALLSTARRRDCESTNRHCRVRLEGSLTCPQYRTLGTSGGLFWSVAQHTHMHPIYDRQQRGSNPRPIDQESGALPPDHKSGTGFLADFLSGSLPSLSKFGKTNHRSIVGQTLITLVSLSVVCCRNDKTLLQWSVPDLYSPGQTFDANLKHWIK